MSWNAHIKKTPLKAKDSKTKIPCIFTIKPGEQGISTEAQNTQKKTKQ